ncbi:MAG TPA: hypothetical protein VN255_16065 [Mycobacterium sp.]|nr:hypothetical protein [Mycobacterium sp.]
MNAGGALSPANQSQMPVYCDDPSHTAESVGPISTDPNFALLVPRDVYIWDRFFYSPPDPLIPLGAHWWPAGPGHDSGQGRAVRPGGAVLPQRRSDAEHDLERNGGVRYKYSPRCRRCQQRGGRWKAEDLRAVIGQLAERGVYGVSLRALDLIKHSGIRTIVR